MPKQILAEEIERFLGTVEGVASARLLTVPSGEIDQVYVTADEGTESRSARRAVVAALITEYGIPVEPWRVQVTTLKRFGSADLPNLKVLRVEEAITGTETTARVQVAWERAGEQRTGTGQARGPAGAQHRLRTLAAAAVDAARAVVEPAQRRITVHQVSVTTCMDRPLVLVGIAAGGPRGQEEFVGAAFQHEGTSGAAVAAALDAVTKWLLRAAVEGRDEGIGMDRRARLEAMRHFARTAGRSQPDPPPAPQEAAPPRDASPAPAISASSPEPRGSASPLSAIDGLRQREPRPGARAATLPPDILEDLRDIRPEQKGGAAMAAHHEGSRVGVASARPARQMVEDEFFQPFIEGRTPVHIRCRDGYEIPRAVVRDVGTYTLLVEADGATELVYKHSIISIRPVGARA